MADSVRVLYLVTEYRLNHKTSIESQCFRSLQAQKPLKRLFLRIED